MSTVYRAHDSLLERFVALKVLHQQYNEDEDFVERFKREARSVAQLQHPNIVTVIDRGEEDGRQYIVFEHIDGENLKELVVRRGRLEVREALAIALEIARGLAFAHDHGLVHRDVKPQNVLLNGDGGAKVTDFGIARSLDVEHGASVTQTGTVLGTSNYIAPEQASGQPVDAHTDVYSLGVVLYEMLTGDVPFPGENFVAVAMKHIQEPSPSVLDVRGDVPLRVAEMVDRALEKDPAQRFPTMDAFASEIETSLAELDDGEDGAVTMVVPAARRLQQHPRRRKAVSRLALLVGLVGVLAIAGVVVGLLTLRGGNGKPVPVGARITVAGVGAFDPYGDGTEHDADAPNATDGNPATYWTTESYNSGLERVKQGVGLVLDALGVTQVSRITVVTDTPGFTAEIRATNIRGGPTQAVSDRKVVARTARFDITQSTPKRYYLVWITKLGSGQHVAHVNEVRAFGKA
ncbi:MAG: eukaryotic-like serine/threonine-protein kinase [Gaiellaceae bacterium]|nr:eukaryotic-like serine/threonine-protein kinase [Gaiellaceae bacterium]